MKVVLVVVPGAFTNYQYNKCRIKNLVVLIMSISRLN